VQASKDVVAALVVVLIIGIVGGYAAGKGKVTTTTLTSTLTETKTTTKLQTVSTTFTTTKTATTTAFKTKTLTSTTTVTKPVTKTLTETRTVTQKLTATMTKTVTVPVTKTVTQTRTVTRTMTTTATVTAKPPVVMAPASIEELVKKVEAKVSAESKACIQCHIIYTPDVVAEWATSRHAKTTPGEALKKPELEREISSTPPENMMNHVVGCYECHGQKPDEHPDTFNHYGYRIHVIVTPKDCATCHAKEVEEYSRSVKANAYYNLLNNPVYMLLVNASTESDMFGIHAGGMKAKESACLACHGTKVVFKGLKTITTSDGMTLQVPDYEGWPNHGVGRVNPDGSKGACTACHPRHSFSIEVARSPYTCGQCHLDPDVPAFNVWKESKHGNIFLVNWKHYNMTAVPWVPGRDFTAPSCATCHMSLLATEDGKVIAPRTHDVGSRIWIRIFGVYAHPQPKTGETWKIKNKGGLPLPYCLADAEPAYQYLINETEMAERKEQMVRICGACHSEDYARTRLDWFEQVVNETNKAILQSTLLLVDAWKKGLAKGLLTGDNPFDEYIERRWVESWLFYANSIRYGAAMNGQDWTTFKRGWYQLTKDLQEMKMLIQLYEMAKNATASKAG